MQPGPLPENFPCHQQDLVFAFLDEIYDRGPMIGLLVGPRGTGKTHVLRRYADECHRRYYERIEARRVIVRQDALKRFVAAGFRSREDRDWFEDQWLKNRKARISEQEFNALIRQRADVKHVPKDLLPEAPPEERPAPNPTIVTPSQVTTAPGMIKLLARRLLGWQGMIWSYEDARNEILKELGRRYRGHFLIFDDVQRLRPDVLNICREFYDDAGVSVVLVGTEELELKLHQQDAKSLLSRISIRERMEPLDAGQVTDLLAGWDDRLVRQVYDSTAGVFRRIVHVVRLCEQIRDAEGAQKITSQILGEALRLIPDLAPKRIPVAAARVDKHSQPGRAALPLQAAITQEARSIKQATG